MRFSALQRAENSSILRLRRHPRGCRNRFQCSSASRKFLNSVNTTDLVILSYRFSALQRAENSSMRPVAPNAPVQNKVSVLFSEPKIPQYGCGTDKSKSYRQFQCSSASRKFLNFTDSRGVSLDALGFSALQRAENSSIIKILLFRKKHVRFSALQRAENSSIDPDYYDPVLAARVSVLFSEPKIPQSPTPPRSLQSNSGFSALQRAENSSMTLNILNVPLGTRFSALQRAENSSIYSSVGN